MAKHGIKTVLGTPTAAPPAWIIRADPEILPVDVNGIRREFGGRHHDCQSNPVYREHIRRIVTAMAKHFADNPNVVGWQVDNELGNSHADLCMCASCTARFRAWLQKKYGSIEALNEAWGTCFWSQGYSCFEEIGAPKLTVTGQNPSQLLDWKRFCSDLIVEFEEFQTALLRKYCPNHFVTHNFMGFSDKVNYFDLAKSLDFVSQDQYPCQFFGEGKDIVYQSSGAAAALELMRSLKKKNIWIMEQQAGPAGWECMGSALRPGRLAMWAVHSIAHGADTVVFFRWRTSPVGTEQYWHGILPHSGVPGRTYRELKAMIAAMRPVMQETRGAGQGAQVGILYAYDQEYAFRIQPQNRNLDYNEQIKKYFGAFYRRNIPVEFVQETEPFEKCRLLIAPLQYLMYPELEEKYRKYVEQGGVLVLTMRTGVKNSTNVCMIDRELPGKLGDLLGIRIPEYDCLGEDTVKVSLDDKTYTACMWSDLIELAGAQSEAEYASEFYAGMPVVTRKAAGKGNAWYVGTEPSDALMDALAEKWLAEANIKPFVSTPRGVEAALRKTEAGSWYFVLNHNDTKVKFTPPADWQPVLANDDSGVLEPFAYRVYRSKN